MTQYIGGVEQGGAAGEVVETNATTATVGSLSVGATTTMLRITGALACDGIVAPVSGTTRVLKIFCAGGSFVWSHDTGTTADRLDGLGTAPLMIGDRGGATVAYDPTSQRWRCVGKSV